MDEEGLKEVESGRAVSGVCRKQCICDQTYYWWKAQYGGLEVSKARRLRREGLVVRQRKRKRIGAVERKPLAPPVCSNQR